MSRVTVSNPRRILLLTAGTGAILAGVVGAFVFMQRPDAARLPTLTMIALGDFVFDQRNGTIEDVPRQFMALDGHRVNVIGEMWMLDTSGRSWNLTQISGRDQHRAPLVQQFVFCHAATPTPQSEGRVKVSGVLRLHLVRADGRVEQLFSLEADKVEPVRETN
ncbi:MAG: hypothetical protein QM770_18155 [Tepidisphaeraceae bacterium]